MAYVKPNAAAKEFGVKTSSLREIAESGVLPDGAVICTQGGQYRYNLDALTKYFISNFKRQNRFKD